MDLDIFISRRQGPWARLEAALSRVEGSGLGAIPARDLREFGLLYRQACSDLVYARTVLRNADLADFLNALVGRAYSAIYRRARFTWRGAARWLARGFPLAVQKRWKLVAASWAVLLLGLGWGYAATLADREAFTYIVPMEYHRLYGRAPQDLRSERFGDPTAESSAAFSAQIYVNNIRVSFLCFALGASYGVLTGVMLLYNGALLGSIGANFHRFGMDLEFWGLIVPHGGIEMSCIAIAGAAGLILGWSLVRPGRLTRSASFAAAAREAVPLALGCAPFLVIAGFIEGFVTPAASLGPWGKIALGAATGAGFWLWLLFPRKRHA